MQSLALLVHFQLEKLVGVWVRFRFKVSNCFKMGNIISRPVDSVDGILSQSLPKTSSPPKSTLPAAPDAQLRGYRYRAARLYLFGLLDITPKRLSIRCKFFNRRVHIQRLPKPWFQASSQESASLSTDVQAHTGCWIGGCAVTSECGIWATGKPAAMWRSGAWTQNVPNLMFFSTRVTKPSIINWYPMWTRSR